MLCVVFLVFPATIMAQGSNGYDLLPNYVEAGSHSAGDGGSVFAIVEEKKAADIYVSADDWKACSAQPAIWRTT